MALRNRFLLTFLILGSLSLSSCQDANIVADTNKEISNRTWSYINKIRVPVTIEDEKANYNIYVNLRHTGDYKYSNIFLLIGTQAPGGKLVKERKEFKLALPDGQWLGKGSGNLYSYQLPYKEKIKLDKKGQYFFEVEQNMRDNPLKEVTDIGIRVEKASNE
ncbi:gliding motility lipoprotein GldH [Flavihumibacter sp. R14]|nr:gliding motility lipoprotein GldH [Flavihumibacter soli]